MGWGLGPVGVGVWADCVGTGTVRRRGTIWGKGQYSIGEGG